MAHAPTKSVCGRCGQTVEGTRATCPHCGGPQQQQQHSEVPPALAIFVALGLLTGVLVLILLVMRASTPHTVEQPAPVERASATPSPSPVAMMIKKPSAEPLPLPHPRPPKALPSGPEPGQRPQKLGLPPEPPSPRAQRDAAAGGEPAPKYPPPPW